MILHPMLARNEAEEDAFERLAIAETILADGRPEERLMGLMLLRGAARNDPAAAYNLANRLTEGEPGSSRIRLAAGLLSRSIRMSRERLSDPHDPDDGDPAEAMVRRVASMAMVNLANIRQYKLGLVEAAHADYLEAAKMHDGNAVAHLNIGQMNFVGVIANPDGPLALHHYRKALEGGITCRRMHPGCECLADVVAAMAATPSQDLTSAMPAIEEALEKGRYVPVLPSTTGIEQDIAAAIERAVDDAFADLNPSSPIERRVTRVASAAATLAGLLATVRSGTDECDPYVAFDILRTVSDGIGKAARRPESLILPRIRDVASVSAGPDACYAMYDADRVEEAVVAIDRSVRAIQKITDDHRLEAGMIHALKIVFGSASSDWRDGLLTTIPNGFRIEPLAGYVRLAVPQSIGNLNPIGALRRMAENPDFLHP